MNKIQEKTRQLTVQNRNTKNDWPFPEYTDAR